MNKYAALGLFSMSCLLLQGCFMLSEDSKPKDPPVPAMPPETQEGRHTFGCLLNGAEWVARRQVVNFLFVSFNPDSLEAQLQTHRYWGDYRLHLHAPLRDSYRKISQEMSISVRLDSIRTGTFPILSDYSYFSDNSVSCSRLSGTTPDTVGTLIITRLDTTARIVAGRFAFRFPASGSCPDVTATNGRFDLRLITSY